MDISLGFHGFATSKLKRCIYLDAKQYNCIGGAAESLLPTRSCPAIGAAYISPCSGARNWVPLVHWVREIAQPPKVLTDTLEPT